METSKNQVKHNIWLAPLDGWTDWPLRQMLHEDSCYVPDMYFTEFVHVQSLIRDIYNNKRILFRKNSKDEHKPLIAQLYGQDGKAFYDSTKKLLKLGYSGIDINMGCSIKKIAQRGDGAGLIRDRDNAVNAVRAVKQAVLDTGIAATVSVKTRLGFETDDGEVWLSQIAKEGVDWITLHGRIYKQAFGDKADWERIGQVAKHLKQRYCFDRLIGNGDIESIEQAKKLQEKYDLYGCMIGRNFRAFLVDESRPLEDQRADMTRSLIKYLRLHRESMMEFFSEEKTAYDFTKKISLMMLKQFENVKPLRNKLVLADGYAAAIGALEDELENLS